MYAFHFEVYVNTGILSATSFNANKIYASIVNAYA